MSYKYNDGGREEAGFKTQTDCGIRAVAIACEITYCEARQILQDASAVGRLGSRAIARGIYKEDMDYALSKLGWSWRQAPKFDGRKARYSDMPKNKKIQDDCCLFKSDQKGRQRRVHSRWRRDQVSFFSQD